MTGAGASGAGRVVFLGSDNALYGDHAVCGGALAMHGGQASAPVPCPHSHGGRFPGLAIRGGNVECPCVKYSLGALGYWQGHGGCLWPHDLLTLSLFKCKANHWFVVHGIRGAWTVADVDWQQARPLAYGAFAAVFRVGEITAAKIGAITAAEAEDQRWAAELGWALPVLDYREGVNLPPDVTREVCAVHGPRADILPPDDYRCACEGKSLDVLLMPLAQAIAREEAESAEAKAFQEMVADQLAQQRGRALDCRPGNLMRWRGRLVVVDFGQEDEWTDV